MKPASRPLDQEGVAAALEEVVVAVVDMAAGAAEEAVAVVDAAAAETESAATVAAEIAGNFNR